MKHLCSSLEGNIWQEVSWGRSVSHSPPQLWLLCTVCSKKKVVTNASAGGDTENWGWYCIVSIIWDVERLFLLFPICQVGKQDEDVWQWQSGEVSGLEGHEIPGESLEASVGKRKACLLCAAAMSRGVSVRWPLCWGAELRQWNEGLVRDHQSQGISPLTANGWQRLAARNAPISVSLGKLETKSSISGYHFVNPPTWKRFLINF